MNPEKLSQLLRDPEAIKDLTIDKLNTLIEKYPYMQQLRDIKAEKLIDFDNAGGVRHEAAIYNGGWSGDSNQDHEIIDLDAIALELEVDLGAEEVSVSKEVIVDQDEKLVVAELEEEVSSVILDEEADELLEIEEPMSLEEQDVIEEVAAVAAGIGISSIVLDEDIKEELQDETSLIDEVFIETDLEEVQDESIDNVSSDAERAPDENKELSEDVGNIQEADLDIQVEESVESELSNTDENAGVQTDSVLESFDKVEFEEVDGGQFASIEELSENEFIQIKAKKKKKKKKKSKKEEAKKGKEKKEGKKRKKKKEKKKEEKEEKKSKKKSAEKNKKEKSNKKKLEKKDSKKDKGLKAKKVEEKKKNSKKKKAKESFVKPKSNYGVWLLEQKQISKKGKKRKKKKKTVEKAMESIKKKKGIVSEPLAELLAAQGHFNQAKAMYSELSLIFPEKSAYFAAQIENLENNK